MVCNYPCYTWTVLLGMVVTGAARSIAVKCTYQSGLEAPLTVTLLYLLGQSLSLLVYGMQAWFATDYDALATSREDHFVGVGDEEEAPEKSVELGARVGAVGDQQRDDTTTALPIKSDESESAITECTTNSPAPTPSSSLSSSASTASLSNTMIEFYASARASFYDEEIPNGSNHGLSIQSAERVQWVHRVPFWAKPAIPSALNLLNSALRWASLVYIDASVAEMMISGLELTLSVVAGRIFRKRMVARSRWVGVVIVAVGVIIIERANSRKHQTSESDGNVNDSELHQTRDVTIGVVLIVLQSILSVLQDIGEEIFMQAADYPATLMLGMEGLYGFCIFLVVYLFAGHTLGIEDIDATMSMLRSEAKLRWVVAGLPFLFAITGIFNIKATEATSAMTRNIWKNMRTVLVWAIALAIFYLGHNSSYGEAWHPESFAILFGFAVMCCGILAYYWYKEQEQTERIIVNAPRE